jgi:hypothetical protein
VWGSLVGLTHEGGLSRHSLRLVVEIALGMDEHHRLLVCVPNLPRSGMVQQPGLSCGASSDSSPGQPGRRYLANLG